jgi:hypothetical protein
MGCRAGQAVAIAAALMLPTALEAQTRIEVTPRIGAYLPFGFLAKAVDPQPDFRGKRQVGTVAAGVLGSIFWNNTKLEAGVDFAPSLVAWTDEDGTRDISARVVLMNVRVGRVFQIDETWSADLAVGGGLIARGGEAWQRTGGSLDRALTAALGAGFEIVPGVTFRVAGDLYVTKLRYTDADVAEHTPWRHELFFTTGIGIPIK